MKANTQFKALNKIFWANVRLISQALGYTDKKTKQVKVYSIDEMVAALKRMGLSTDHLENGAGTTDLGENLLNYFAYRADVLNTFVEPHLMDAEQASEVFYELKSTLNPTCPLPMNKQKGEKKKPAFLTGIVNMLIEANIGSLSCSYDPRNLTTFTKDNKPLRTLARRVDGCFPSHVNPIAIWEIKEYYYTTTFGSRVADGIYETLLDGLELEELGKYEDMGAMHLLILDSHRTWWLSGRPYLCRVIDMVNMGYVDEVLFGSEVVEHLPDIVKQWVLDVQQDVNRLFQ
jgi:hypothetical protein